MDRAFVNTVLGLCGATVSTFIMSRLVKGKFDMVHIQNATLAGGVAVGSAADLYLHPAGAIAIGMVAGVLSVCGYEFLSDWMDEKLGIADTCGVHNLHGMPEALSVPLPLPYLKGMGSMLTLVMTTPMMTVLAVTVIRLGIIAMGNRRECRYWPSW